MENNLLSGFYSVCNFCKEGQFTTDTQNTEFEQKHATHEINIISGPQFLSDYLSNGFIDIHRPDLQPIGTSIGPVVKKDIIESFKTAKNIRMKYLQQANKKEKKEDFITEVIRKTLPVVYIIPKIKYDIIEFTKEEWCLPTISHF